MALALAVSQTPPLSDGRRTRILARAYQEVAHYLGNTPAVCRASYVDPRVVELWDRGETIRGSLEDLGAESGIGELATQGAVEDAVRRLLQRA
jgi:DNA topoisomerase IB